MVETEDERQPPPSRRHRPLALAAAALALLLALTVGPAFARPLAEKIQEKRDAIERTKEREGVLTADIRRQAERIDVLRGRVAGLRTRELRVQDELQDRQSDLDEARAELTRARDRLERMRKRLARSRVVLERRLVEIYKSGEPDMLTVVLESEGFSDLVARTDYLQRIGDQDSRVVGRYRSLRDESRYIVSRLTELEEKIEAARNEIAAKRRELARTRASMETTQVSLEGAQARRETALASVQSKRREHEGELNILEEEEQRIRAQLAASQPQPSGAGEGAASAPAGPVRQGGGGMVWPVNGPVVSPFGMRWGRLHAGVDIASPSGTPIRAAKAGSVALAAWTGGYGNYVCVNHGGALSTCYAHLSSYATSTGASVSQGQVIGSVGCTGHCYGDHLHFEVRINGGPVDPMGYL